MSPTRFANIVTSLSLVVLAGCATYRPCEPAPVAIAGSQPTRSCRVDGCTLAPDFNFTDCCDRHDRLYWQGGTKTQRRDADKQLRQCIADHGHGSLAEYYYLGVRLGGAPWWPTPWRWGFGWDYFHGYEPEAKRSGVESEQHDVP